MNADEDGNQGASGGISYDGKIAGLYDLEETLGSGHFAVVKLARHVFTGAKVAVKVVDKTKLDEVSKAHLFQEVRCMKLVQHPNVVRLYEVIDTQTKLYLVLELGDGGDLYDYIMKHENGLSEDLAKKYFRQIVKAISYCHQLHVVHRDLKPENVVFFEKLGIVKLTDFGFSNKFSPGQKLETSCGSLAYSAPEILLGDSYDAPAVDVWSLGVILYMLVCGQPPFEKANDSETLTMIMDCKYTVPPHITDACRKLIGTMLVRDPECRASLEQIANDPWLQQSASSELADYLPLVSRQELSEEDHVFILHKMINGKIASKEEILQALDKNQYNHITATYFLLGELRLRKRREEQMKKYLAQKTENSSLKKQTDVGHVVFNADNRNLLEENKLGVPLNLGVTTSAGFGVFPVQANQMEKRDRKCSIVREEDEDESACEFSTEKNQLKVAVTRRESISDGRLNRLVQERALPSVLVPIAVVNATLAEKFRQIEPYKEGFIVPKITTLSPKDVSSGDLENIKINKYKQSTSSNKNPVLTHRKTKLNKIRTPSCSSSEASDDDTKTRSKKKMSNKFVGDTPTRFRMHRRDSHDDSSDSQDQSTFPSANTQLSNIITTAATSSGSGKKSEQHKDKNCKSEDTRKSSHSNTKQKKQVREQGKPALVYKLGSMLLSRSRRMRESQSLDRIAEAQEYVQRRRCSARHRNSLYNLSSLSVAEIKEEYDEELDNNDDVRTNVAATTKTSVQNDKQFQNLEEDGQKISTLDSINEIDLVIGLTKAIHVSQSRCSVSIRKIRRLEKYLPVVNFS